MAVKDKKGLGIGLDALFAANEIDDEQGSELLTLPISKVEPRKEQPREFYLVHWQLLLHSQLKEDLCSQS